MPRLDDHIALVTGASRGAGRGIALALGEAGAKVYVTGRSVAAETTTDSLPGTIEKTAAEVRERGGIGVPVRCDHTNDDEVAALFRRIGVEQGHLDVLVNNVWGGYEGHDGATFGGRFWEQPLGYWKGMFEAGLRAHLVASREAARFMITRRRGLIVSTTAWDRDRYLRSLIYDVAKAAINRMIFAMAEELREYGVAAIAIAPGFMRTERVLAAHAENPFDLGATESPEYVGRAVVHLATDPDVMSRSGRVIKVGDLAREYGFTDVDGRQVPPFELP